MGDAAGRAATELGQPLMPWQRLVADVGLELLPDGRPAYREVIVTVPRQNGKTILLLSVMLQRALGWETPQRVLYSAQTGNDARKKLVEDWAPILDRRKNRLLIRRILRGMGNESIDFRNGSRVVLLASSEDSGHGKTIDLAMHDEIFSDVDDRREQATTPAMNTRPAGQMWFTSTMGTDDSVFLNAKVEAGRRAVNDPESRVAYFEWSADREADPDDPATWWSCMPALGYTIDETVVRAARQSMRDGEFRRAYLNQPSSSDERVISVQAWMAVQDDRAKPDSPFVFGFDVNPERSWSAITVADGTALELLDHRRGVGWAVDRLIELADKWNAPVALDVSGPAGSFLRDLSDRGVKVVEVAGRDLVQACGAFYDRVLEQKIRVLPHADLDEAVAGASKRSVQDAWAWARKSSNVDITPLVAATVACWAAGVKQSSGAIWMAVD